MQNVHTRVLLVAIALVFLASCGGADNSADNSKVTPVSNDVKATPEASTMTSPGKPSAPISFRYEVEGTPIVGQPVAIKVFATTSLADAPIRVNYRVVDTSSMLFPRSQTQRRTFSATEREEFSAQKITVVPQREGRLYLNVSAEIDTAEGTMIKTTSIPIQVGSAPPDLKVNGTLVETEDGEVVISMPAD